MIPVRVNQLDNAFHVHFNGYSKIQGICSYLLLFYAAECGLKSIWLKQNKLRTTNKIADRQMLSKYGHNLNIWIKEIKIPANQVKKPPHFRLSSDNSTLDLAQAHQVWRYGIPIQSQDEQELIEWLKNLCYWIKENINQ